MFFRHFYCPLQSTAADKMLSCWHTFPCCASSGIQTSQCLWPIATPIFLTACLYKPCEQQMMSWALSPWSLEPHPVFFVRESETSHSEPFPLHLITFFCLGTADMQNQSWLESIHCFSPCCLLSCSQLFDFSIRASVSFVHPNILAQSNNGEHVVVF